MRRTHARQKSTTAPADAHGRALLSKGARHHSTMKLAAVERSLLKAVERGEWTRVEGLPSLRRRYTRFAEAQRRRDRER